jgi:uncharacterized protein YbjQ (UPF0145 family)
MPLPIFTVQTFNQSVLQPAGAVFAQRVESVQIARNFFAGTSNTAGGRSTMMEKKMNDLTTALLEELDQQATKKYPNAVALIDVNIDFSDMGKNDSNMFLAGQASATALIKRSKPAQVNSEVVSKPVVPIAPQTQPYQAAVLPTQPYQAPMFPTQPQAPRQNYTTRQNYPRQNLAPRQNYTRQNYTRQNIAPRQNLAPGPPLPPLSDLDVGVPRPISGGKKTKAKSRKNRK